MDKKIVFITGISRGIGLEIAKCFMNDGYYVIGTSRSPFSINDETLSIGNKFNIEGVIDFHGIERSVFLNVSIFPRDKYLIGMTEFKISLSDHSVDRPSLLFVPISNNILIKCNLFCELSSFKNYVQK